MLKFKAWDPQGEKWHENSDLLMEASGKVWVGDINSKSNPMALVNEENIVYSTGCTSDEKDIYEGHIIYWEIDNGVGVESFTGEVTWSEKTKNFKGEFKWLVKYEDGLYDELSIVSHYRDSVKIIGSKQEGLY